MADKALMRLYAAHRRGIKAYINKKLGDPETAEDLTQEAFLRLTEGGGGAITHGEHGSIGPHITSPWITVGRLQGGALTPRIWRVLAL